jgi:hypothetical protein
MKKTLIALAVALSVALMASCVSTYPMAGATGKVGSKVGTASVLSILGFPPAGDAGIVAAAKQGGISTVGTVDVKVSWFVVVTTLTTVVTGE